jgi:hypothetical protein
LRATTIGSAELALDNRSKQDENRKKAQPALAGPQLWSDTILGLLPSLPRADGSHVRVAVFLVNNKRKQRSGSDHTRRLVLHTTQQRVAALSCPGRSAATQISFAVTRCIASGTRDSARRVRSLIHFSNSPSRSRGAFLRPGLLTFASLTRIEGWAERRETFGCVRGTRWACHDAARQALARRLASHSASRRA